MEALLSAVEASAVAQWLRFSRWGYAGINALHIFGIGLLVGSVIPLNLRLFGFWQSVDRAGLVRVLSPSAAAGLSIAIGTGLLLFSVRATEYSTLSILQFKLGLVAAGAFAALALHFTSGALLRDASPRRLKAHAVLSIVCWTGALVSGRLIAFFQ